MFKIAVFAFIFAFKAYSLTLEDLRSPLIQKHEKGPLKSSHLIAIEEALRELGKPEHFWSLQEKLDTSDLESMSAYIHACQMSGETLGTYKSGERKTYFMAHEFGVEPEQIEWGGEILEEIEKAYKSRTLSQDGRVLLMIQEQGIICLRPGVSFGKTLSTFVHELTHLLGDNGKTSDVSGYENEQDYIEKRYFSSGGEHEAYKAGIEIKKLLALKFGFYDSTRPLRYFDGERFNEEGLQSYILDELGYRKKFSADYRQALMGAYNTKVQELNIALDLQGIYEQNLEIGKSNLKIARSKEDILTYESWVAFYEDLIRQSRESRHEGRIQLKALESKLLIDSI